MTREEEIYIAINNLQIGVYDEDISLDNDEYNNDEYNGRDIQDAFYAGAKWADENPKSPWISVKDDLPCNHEELFENSSIYDKETKCVIACDNEHNIDFDYMVNCGGKWSWARNESNTHWFTIPKLPNM